jgi:hypothetical protein
MKILSKRLFPEENSVPLDSQSASQVCQFLLFGEYILYMPEITDLLLTN